MNFYIDILFNMTCKLNMKYLLVFNIPNISMYYIVYIYIYIYYIIILINYILSYHIYIYIYIFRKLY